MLPFNQIAGQQTRRHEQGRTAAMGNLSRREVIRASVQLATAGSLACPYVANAAATTAQVWWIQGFVQEEDTAFRAAVDDYEKASGDKLDYSIIPYAPMRQKIVSAVTSGLVPDLFQNSPTEAIALFAWDDKLMDVTDVVETQKSEYTETALLSALCYDNIEKRRSYYGVPYLTAGLPIHIWRSLVEKAGLKIEEIPKTWDAYFDFFKGVQRKLRMQGERHTYGLGFQVTTNGNDPNNLFNYFLIAYGGKDIVTKDGKPHLDDPKVRQAAVRALAYPALAYQQGYVPQSAINWNDADDNNAFHSRQIVMDIDGTISTEVAVIHNPDDYRDIVTMGLPNDNDGNPVPTQIANSFGMIPKGAKNPAVAKEFLKYLIQPKISNAYLKAGLGRSIPCMRSIVSDDPWWLDPSDQHRSAYVRQALLGLTTPAFWVFNPAYAQVQNEHVWSTGWNDIMTGGMTPEAAAEKAFRRVEEIFAKYPIVQS
jgi:multiple sugar transport system substrate-binding protein